MMKTHQETTNYIRYITFLAAFSALAYLSVFFIKIPLIAFLKYEPKDIIIIIGGLVFGPVFTILLAVIVPFIELITVSSTGIIGFIMNVLSTICFVLPPELLYAAHRKSKNLIIGLGLGIISLTAVMVLWNYFLAPVFLGFTREVVVKMLVPVIIPFNLIKGAINSGFILALYQPITSLLLKSNVLIMSDFNGVKHEKKVITFIIIGLTIISITTLFIL